MLHISSPFEILKDYDEEDTEMFYQAMKEHEADERERIADEVIAQRRRMSLYATGTFHPDDPRSAYEE